MSDGTTRLPKSITTPSGGVVRFRQIEEQPLTGRDIRKWRTLYNESGRGDYTQKTIELLFALFVTGWEFEKLPRLPLPSESVESIDLLQADDQFEIEDVLHPMIDELNGLAASKRREGGTGPGSPTRPSSV